MTRRRAAILLLAAAGAAATVHGLWIPAKALLAQELLGRAWAAERAGAAAARPAVRPWPWADTHPVAHLRVPAHGRDLIVLAGASGRTLAFAPGHVTGTAAPGSDGNIVIAGHRDTHFAFLRHLAEGEEVVLEDAAGRVRRYRVEAMAVVDRKRTDLLAPTAVATLTLVTCYPFGAIDPGGPLRYVVRATAVPGGAGGHPQTGPGMAATAGAAFGLDEPLSPARSRVRSAPPARPAPAGSRS